MSKDLHVFEDPIQLLEGMWPTPLLKLNIGKDVWGKLEFYNPFSKSIKDRTAWFLFKDALEKNSKELVEATSGNLGIALSSLSVIFNKKFTSFIPQQAPKSFATLMKVLGAQVIQLGKSTTELLPLVKSYTKNSNALHLDQFHNPLNYLTHYHTTAREIDEQLKSKGKTPMRIIATAGTGGHLTGLSLFFKEKYGNNIEIVGVQPAEGSHIPGIKRQSNDGFISDAKIDRMIDISLEEAIQGIIKVARTSGILIGISAGATVAAYEKIMDEKTTILIFPDDIFKYVDYLENYM
ncbi:pyridoxal-phosphate dependent enzyme [Acidianus sulfidivorans JP7]|uniref:Cysteine synthase n=1 Tax=Acidianus sulfidivorans JP7 TaxID=619593 RepID=A0A2U9INX8_9CREN|nr:PLP-dependent cysteine synthase family protein [Acidianus sulfidivorans]AWR97701.1 pyridoxal-phosphate dependent enzyme [Acidianus sulfidivorans JP7]